MDGLVLGVNDVVGQCVPSEAHAGVQDRRGEKPCANITR